MTETTEEHEHEWVAVPVDQGDEPTIYKCECGATKDA